MTSEAFQAWLKATRRRPLVMGVLNVTPDSFSDGGRFVGEHAVDTAADAALAMLDEGADLIDIGGESTRPGSLPVSEEEQLRRVIPVLQALGAAVRRLQAPERGVMTFSIDTTRASVAEAALDAGAHIVNDVSAGRDDPRMLSMIARRGAVAVLMHMQGTPATMQVNPVYGDVTQEVTTFLSERLELAISAGIDPSNIILDPGIGFGKTPSHNLKLLRDLRAIIALGRPVLVGTSRKSFIQAAAGRTGRTAPDRLFGTAATVAWAIGCGAAMIRVHDVGPMSQVSRVIEAIQSVGGLGPADDFFHNQ